MTALQSKHGACPTCSDARTTHFHDRCPDREMREQPTPCVNATFAEVRAGRHLTFELDRVCEACR